MSIRFSPNRFSCALVLSIAALFVCASDPVADEFIDLREIGVMHDGDAAAGKEKSATCVACHGANGVSPVPTFPNLRGMTAEYLYWQLVDYKDGTVPQPVMTPLVATLGDQDLRDLATYYAEAGNSPLSTPTAPAGTADGDSARQGARLYLNGDAGQGIPACQGCHGEDARGHPLATRANAAVTYRTYPPLRGQNAGYLVTKLTGYRDGRLGNSTNDFIMTGVARHLDDASIKAIATWLSTRPVD